MIKTPPLVSLTEINGPTREKYEPDRRGHLEVMGLFNDWKFFRDLLCLERRMAFPKYYERSLSYATRKGMRLMSK